MIKKRLKYVMLLLLLAVACESNSDVKVEVKNDSSISRSNESVEVEWNKITAKLTDVTPESVVVLCNGKQIPSQVLFENGDEAKPYGLLFQASVEAGEKVEYTIEKGVREEYESKVFSRLIPERYDDYAWENNLVAQRVYGKALEWELVSQGIDVWVKKVPYLIIDKWYGIGHYHEDIGEGMDCYKVGQTLGAGGSAPVVGKKIALSRNMVKAERISNGPIRTEFILYYDPYTVDDSEVAVTKRLSLDANTRFTKVVDVYSGDFKKLDVGVGFVVHTKKAPSVETDDMIAIFEPASDDQHNVGGNIGVAVIVPENTASAQVQKHMLKMVDTKPGKPSTYYVGSAWGRGGMPTSDDWFAHCKEASSIIAKPLKVTVK